MNYIIDTTGPSGNSRERSDEIPPTLPEEVLLSGVRRIVWYWRENYAGGCWEPFRFEGVR